MKELLAPAGDLKTAKIAVNHGADAVYLGYSAFSARAGAVNFGESELREIVAYAHFFGAKVYVAMNTMVKENEVESFLRTLLNVWSIGADAIILQDVFLGKYIHETYPEICLHLSTQAGVNNVEATKLAKEYGFSRVILARETRIEEIGEITKILETEVFVQGALCTCYSGQCYLSGFVGNNSGNRGRCKQPCRKKYVYLDQTREYTGYPLSLADLCVGEKIEELVEVGVSSFKIEGRMRRSEYVAAAVDYYRDLLDGKESKTHLSNLKRAYNRGNYTRGLAFGQDKRLISDKIQGHIGETIGTVSVQKGKYICRTQERGNEGDAYKIIRGGTEVCGARFAENRKDGILLSAPVPLKEGDTVAITTDVNLFSLNDLSRKRVVSLSLYFEVGKKPVAIYGDLTVYGEKETLSAQKLPMTEEDVRQSFSKVDLYPFEVNADVRITGNCFMPRSELNAFRRKVFEEIFNFETAIKRTDYAYREVCFPKRETIGGTIVIGSTFSFEEKVETLVFKPFDYTVEREYERFFAFAKTHADRTALYVPGFLNADDVRILSEAIAPFDLVYTDGLEGIGLAKLWGKPVIGGTGLNISNRIQASNFDAFVVSKELDHAEQRQVGGSVLSVGSVKVMDLLYCPFHKNCKECNRNGFYRLKDEEGRIFLLRRYRLSACRFELFNCADLVALQLFAPAVYDFSTVEEQDRALRATKNESLKELFPSYTSGHSAHTVL